MDYMRLFAELTDVTIKMVGSVAIIGFSVIILVGLIGGWLWVGKHLLHWVAKVGAEFKECFTPPEPTGKKVKAT